MLSEDIPVTMPGLPMRLTISAPQQFKALGDPTRMSILALIQHQPATAKQIASRLKISPGAIGHHLQVLEEAGLIQVVARRLVHGIVAKYYTRTARIFLYDSSPEIEGETPFALHLITRARNELTESLETGMETSHTWVAFPRTRLSPERAQHYQDRLNALVDDFLHEMVDPDGEVYSFFTIFFKAPAYLQQLIEKEDTSPEADEL